MLKHTRNTNNSGIRFYRQIYNGLLMNNIAPKLQKNAGHTKLTSASFKNAKATKFLLQSAFYAFKARTCKVLPFYNFWFKFYDKLCSSYLIVDFFTPI